MVCGYWGVSRGLGLLQVAQGDDCCPAIFGEQESSKAEIFSHNTAVIDHRADPVDSGA